MTGAMTVWTSILTQQRGPHRRCLARLPGGLLVLATLAPIGAFAQWSSCGSALCTTTHVGIGTTTEPTSPSVEVYGSTPEVRVESAGSGDSGWLSFYNSGGRRGYIQYLGAAAQLTFDAGGSAHGFGFTGGYVGIGTTTPHNPVDIAGTVAGGHYNGLMVSNSDGTAGAGASISLALGNAGTTATGKIENLIEGSGIAGIAFSTFYSGIHESVRISGSGRLGIGATPITLLSNTDTGQHDGARGVSGRGITWVQTSSSDTGYTAGFVNPQAYTGAGNTAHGVFVKIADTNAQSNILHLLSGSNVSRLLVRGDGTVGIGTTTPCAGSVSSCKLAVKGAVRANEVIVDTGWSDYVFAPDYRLAPLSEVGKFIEDNHHLPNIPAAAEVAEKGISLGDMQAKLLAKIEELTLHMIAAEKRADRLEQENRELRSLGQRVAALESR